MERVFMKSPFPDVLSKIGLVNLNVMLHKLGSNARDNERQSNGIRTRSLLGAKTANQRRGVAQAYRQLNGKRSDLRFSWASRI